MLSGFEFLIANWNLPLYLGLLLCFWITMDIIMSYLLSWPTIVFSLVMLIARRLNAYYTLCVLCPQILKPADKKKFTYGLNSGRPLTPPRGPAKNKGKKWVAGVERELCLNCNYWCIWKYCPLGDKYHETFDFFKNLDWIWVRKWRGHATVTMFVYICMYCGILLQLAWWVLVSYMYMYLHSCQPLAMILTKLLIM